MESKKRRKPRERKFLNHYFLLRNQIINDGIIEYYDEEDGRFEGTDWRPTKKRHLFDIFDKLGIGIVHPDDLRRINNIANNKLKNSHNQLLARNIILIMDRYFSYLLKSKPIDFDKVEKTSLMNQMSKKDLAFFESVKTINIEKMLAQKYARLSKFLRMLPPDDIFCKIAKVKRIDFLKIKKSKIFEDYFTREITSWVFPKGELLKMDKDKQYQPRFHLKTNEQTKALVSEIIIDWEKYKESINKYDKSTVSYNDDYNENALEENERIQELGDDLF
jgi:hypothetical protein